MTLTEISRTTTSGVLGALSRPGQGLPLILIHGAMADADGWVQVAEELKTSRPLLLPTRRGRTPSPPTAPGYSIEQEVQDLLGWLDDAGGPVDLVAHSFGGLVACEAVVRGAAVRSLLLYEPVVWPFGERALPELEEALACDDLDLAVELVNTRISGYSSAHVDSLRDSPAWGRLRELARPVVDELRALSSYGPDISRFAGISTPTRLIAGETSRHRPPYGPAIDRYLDSINDVEVHILPGEDHIAHVTAPRMVATAVDRWIAEIQHR